MVRIFAFGTLKRGFPLHEEGLAGADRLGLARTVDAFPMLIAGPWFAPMMLDRPGEGLCVKGELYAIDDRCLAVLDRLESVGKPGNFRRLVRVLPMGGGPAIAAFSYMKSPELAVPVHSEYLEEYRDHRFIPPGRRW
ncbi:gamma-glutamylcyclotransferase family protein [Nitratireductor sp. GCM10026969]|uniref:gamma-glutamylcyclotransferase family protein n=1 Tax=Nitratireductor sp. GCM10026969 TaxID=3252645 RepID=UPI00360D93BC